MVLTRRSAVLGLALGFLLLGLLGGCSESLFGARGHGGDGGGGDDGGITGCTAPCDADAAGEFDGTAGGMHNRWRYLNDHRDRTWTPMTVNTTDKVMTGADPGVRITTCHAFPDEEACRTLAGALLVSTVSPNTNDPAIELTLAKPQVLALHVEALVPAGGSDQTIRLYRNSREDELFTGTAMPGTVFDQMITLDALPGDRFLVAIGAKVSGAANIGLNLFAKGTGDPFPATCQVTLPFGNPSGTTVNDLCGSTVFTHYSGVGSVTPSSFTANNGPFPEQGLAAEFSGNEFFRRGTGPLTFPPLDWMKDVTVQFWVKAALPSVSRPEVLFSDIDPDYGSGMEISFTQSSMTMLDVRVCKAPPIRPAAAEFVDLVSTYQGLTAWHFIRVVRAGGAVRVCVNGSSVATMPTQPCTEPSPNPLALGANTAQSDPSLNGNLDDVRVLTGALPCN